MARDRGPRSAACKLPIARRHRARIGRWRAATMEMHCRVGSGGDATRRAIEEAQLRILLRVAFADLETEAVEAQRVLTEQSARLQARQEEMDSLVERKRALVQRFTALRAAGGAPSPSSAAGSATPPPRGQPHQPPFQDVWRNESLVFTLQDEDFELPQAQVPSLLPFPSQLLQQATQVQSAIPLAAPALGLACPGPGRRRLRKRWPAGRRALAAGARSAGPSATAAGPDLATEEAAMVPMKAQKKSSAEPMSKGGLAEFLASETELNKSECMKVMNSFGGVAIPSKACKAMGVDSQVHYKNTYESAGDPGHDIADRSAVPGRRLRQKALDSIQQVQGLHWQDTAGKGVQADIGPVAGEVLQGSLGSLGEAEGNAEFKKLHTEKPCHLSHPGERGAAGAPSHLPPPRPQRAVLRLPVPHRHGLAVEGRLRREA